MSSSSTVTSTNNNSNAFIKPLVGAAVAVAADKFILNNNDLNKSLMFGASVGAGLYAATLIAPMIPPLIPPTTLSNGKTIQDRVVEVGSGAGSAYALNRFVLKNDYSRGEMFKRLAIIAACDFVGEYASDYMSGNPLSYL